jgi:spermidine synthase
MTRDLRHWACKAISYFWDLNAETAVSGVSGKLQVRMVNGKLLLDAPHANYSFGSLHLLFRKVFLHLGTGNHPPSNLLLLGLGGGSVIAILRDEYHLDLPVTAVEKDPEVIRIAHEYFGLGGYSNIDILCMDAEEYARQATEHFNLIIIDLFIDNKVPEPFTRLPFLRDCGRILSPGGRIVFNFIVKDQAGSRNYQALRNNLGTAGFVCTELRIFSTNRVLLISLP